MTGAIMGTMARVEVKHPDNPPAPEGSQGPDPAVLLVGAGRDLEDALCTALQRHRIFVETTSAANLVSATIAAAPDLIVIAGEAAKDGAVGLLRDLAASALTSVVPVALLQDGATVDERLQAFRHGAVAVIARSASVDAIADRIAHLASEIPERGNESLGKVGESTLREFVDALARELRQGVLSVKGGSSGAEVRLVLGEGRPLAELVDDFVSRVQRHIVAAEPLEYEFDERAAGTVAWLDARDRAGSKATADLTDIAIALADPDAARADLLAQALRERGALVMVSDLDPPPVRYARLRQMNPHVLLIGQDDLEGRGYHLVRQLRHDPRLRWTFLLVVRWSELTPEDGLPLLERIVPKVADLARPLRALRERISAAQGPVVVRLESVGPVHLLGLLAALPGTRRVEFRHRRLKACIDVGEALIVGATAERLDVPGERLDGPVALAAVLQLGSGRAQIQRVEQPASTNLMATLDAALDLADREKPPIPPSIPGPPWPEQRPSGSTRSIPAAPRGPNIVSASPESSTEDSAAERQAPHRQPAATVLGMGPSSPGTENADSLADTYLDVGFSTADRETPEIPLTPSPPPPSSSSGRERRHPGTVTRQGEPLGNATTVAIPDTILAGMPSPNRDFDTLADGAEEESQETPESTPITRPDKHPWGLRTLDRLVEFLERLVLRARPRLERRRARDVATMGAVALISLGTAFAAALVIAWLTLGGAEELEQPSAEGSGSAIPAPASALAPSTAKVGADSTAGRWPLKRASDNPSPSCSELERKSRKPVQRFPGASFYQVKLGRQALIRGDLDEAQLAYCRAIALDPDNGSAQSEMARLLVLRRDGVGAERQARAAMKLAPGSRVLRGILGDALARLGRIDEARAAFIYEAQADPSNDYSIQALYDATSKSAERELQKGSWAEAERYYRRALVLAPKDARGAVGLAVALTRLGEKDRAAKWANFALSLGGLGPREHTTLRGVLAETSSPGG